MYRTHGYAILDPILLPNFSNCKEFSRSGTGRWTHSNLAASGFYRGTCAWQTDIRIRRSNRSKGNLK